VIFYIFIKDFNYFISFNHFKIEPCSFSFITNLCSLLKWLISIIFKNLSSQGEKYFLFIFFDLSFLGYLD
jgi:hypothetical protein